MIDLQKLVDEAYEEGKQAYKDGKKSKYNPYDGVTEDYQFEAWEEGYYNSVTWDY